METINDFLWLRHMVVGKILERFDAGTFHVVSIAMPPDSPNRRDSYRYRMLLFVDEAQRPVAAYNLESTILGAPFLSEQIGSTHRTIGPADEDMPYDAFRTWALGRALELEHDRNQN
jgi:hypothetical protein